MKITEEVADRLWWNFWER